MYDGTILYKGREYMGISMIGSISAYLKTAELKQGWQFRQQNGYEKGNMTVEDWMKKQQEKIGFRPPEPQNQTMTNIEHKVRAGKSLTPKERKYLQEHNPDLLKMADENETAKRNFEKELKECRTKEDVQRLRMKYINVSMTKLNAVVNNPNIPENKKLEIAMQENAKVMATQDALATFIKKGGYEKLPTEAEKLEVEKHEKEREEAKLHPEKPEQAENTEQTQENTAGTEEAQTKPLPEQQTDKAEKAEAELPFEKNVDANVMEIQKVKRAKAAAAYAASANAGNVISSFNITAQTSLVDQKA